MYKICGTCKEIKLFTEFGKKKTNKDGYQYSCKLCKKIWADNNKDYFKKYREDNKEHIKTLCSDWYKLNRENILKFIMDNREYISKRERNYRKMNSHKRNAMNAKRRASKLKATPAWLIPEQLVEIENFYLTAKNLKTLTGVIHHVDHIVPLQGRNVCGLHVPWNLQILTATENLHKSNIFEIEGE